MKPMTLDDMVEQFMAAYPEISDKEVKMLEKFVDFSIASGFDHIDIDETNKAMQAMDVIVDAVAATRLAMDKRGAFDEPWMNKAESEALKAEFFKNFNHIFGANIIHTPHGN